MFKKIGDERAFNGILNQIIDNIQNGKLKAGDALPAERTMAETMGVSRPAVREVLRALELLGIIKPVPGGGNYITENLDTWLIGPLTILFKLNNGYLKQNRQFRVDPAEIHKSRQGGSPGEKGFLRILDHLGKSSCKSEKTIKTPKIYK